MGSPLQAIMSLLQAPRPKPPVTVRPDYGLTGAQVLQPQRSPYERTMRPGETRSPDELQDMLAEVILAAGAGASPLVGPRGKDLARAARPRPSAAQPISPVPTPPKPEPWNEQASPLSHLPGEYVSATGNKMHEGQVRMLERHNGFVIDKVDGGFRIVDPTNGRSWNYGSIVQAIGDFGFGQ